MSYLLLYYYSYILLRSIAFKNLSWITDNLLLSIIIPTTNLSKVSSVGGQTNKQEKNLLKVEVGLINNTRKFGIILHTRNYFQQNQGPLISS
jgi:hypothetical protein